MDADEPDFMARTEKEDKDLNGLGGGHVLVVDHTKVVRNEVYVLGADFGAGRPEWKSVFCRGRRSNGSTTICRSRTVL